MKRVIAAAVKSNIEGLNELFKSYKISKPVTPENLAVAVLTFGDPFIADLDEFIVKPTTDLISTFSDDQLSCFDDDGDEYSHFIKKIKEKRAGKKESDDDDEKSGIFSKIKERRALKKESKDYSASEPKTRRKGLGAAIIGGVIETGSSVVGTVKDIKGRFNPVSDDGAGTSYQDQSESVKYAAPEGKKSNYLLYVGIAAAVLVVIVAVVLMSKKK